MRPSPVRKVGEARGGGRPHGRRERRCVSAASAGKEPHRRRGRTCAGLRDKAIPRDIISIQNKRQNIAQRPLAGRRVPSQKRMRFIEQPGAGEAARPARRARARCTKKRLPVQKGAFKTKAARLARA